MPQSTITHKKAFSIPISLYRKSFEIEVYSDYKNGYIFYRKNNGVKEPLLRSEALALKDALDSSIQNRISIKGLMPPDIIYVDMVAHSNIIWKVKTDVFDLTLQKGKTTEIVKMKLPNMVFQYIDNKLNVFFVKKFLLAIEDTKLFHSIFYNVNDNNVCISLPTKIEGSVASITKTLEHYFFSSPFTHVWGTFLFKETEDVINFTPVRLWKHFIEIGEIKEDLLLTTGKTIKDLL